VIKSLLRYLSLFGSTSTLFCCAIPSLFVALGLGASFAGLLSSFPQLLWLGDHKEFVFGFTGSILIFNAYEQFKKVNIACPTPHLLPHLNRDLTPANISPALATLCKSSRTQGRWILLISIFFYGTGCWFAFIAK
jgi:hypothetical protein